MTTAEKIKVMQAFEDGEQIQYMFKGNDFWRDCFNPIWNWNIFEYRIKPAPKNITYRPYKDTKEMIADHKERFRVNCPPYAMPMIWVVSENSKSLITAFESKVVWLLELNHVSMDLGQLFKKCTYLDGSPVGKLVEE